MATARSNRSGLSTNGTRWCSWNATRSSRLEESKDFTRGGGSAQGQQRRRDQRRLEHRRWHAPRRGRQCHSCRGLIAGDSRPTDIQRQSLRLAGFRRLRRRRCSKFPAAGRIYVRPARVSRCLTAARREGRIVSITKGMWAPVEEGWRHLGAHPPGEYLDDLMAHLGHRHYVAYTNGTAGAPFSPIELYLAGLASHHSFSEGGVPSSGRRLLPGPHDRRSAPQIRAQLPRRQRARASPAVWARGPTQTSTNQLTVKQPHGWLGGVP